jgi:uncharacterized protein YjbI with pentapeptide repeats
MLYEIKHRFTGTVLFSLETESLKLCVQAAVKAKAYLRGAYLDGADLRGADLRGAYLSGADLSGAYLSGAYLDGADLRGADLRGAYLRGAYLDGADLRGADLRGADLRGAYLSGADLSGAYLRGAYLGGATGVIHLGAPNGWHAHAWLRDGWLSIRVGCHEFRLAEAREYWQGKPNRREVMAALDYAETVAAIREWAVSEPAKQEAA